MYSVELYSVMLESSVTRELGAAVAEFQPITSSAIYVTSNWELEICFEYDADDQHFVETFFISRDGWMPRYNG